MTNSETVDFTGVLGCFLYGKNVFFFSWFFYTFLAQNLFLFLTEATSSFNIFC